MIDTSIMADEPSKWSLLNWCNEMETAKECRDDDDDDDDDDDYDDGGDDGCCFCLVW